MDTENKKELFADLNKCRNEINSINKDLNRYNREKEAMYRKKHELSSNIREKIVSIKESKKKRDSLTKRVKELKDKRRNLNDESRKKISELVDLKKETKHLTLKSKVKNPYWIKGEIDRIEVKLETEAMPYDKEKELTTKLKKLKKSLDETSIVTGNIDLIRKFNSKINSTKTNSTATHNELQKLAAESQQLHESLIKTSKEVDKLKIEEGLTIKNYFDSKKKFKEINDKLEQKLSYMNEIRQKINKFQLEEDEKRKLRETMVVKSKEQEMEDKIKTGKKLTTDDFLAFQESIKKIP